MCVCVCVLLWDTDVSGGRTAEFRGMFNPQSDCVCTSCSSSAEEKKKKTRRNNPCFYLSERSCCLMPFVNLSLQQLCQNKDDLSAHHPSFILCRRHCERLNSNASTHLKCYMGSWTLGPVVRFLSFFLFFHAKHFILLIILVFAKLQPSGLKIEVWNWSFSISHTHSLIKCQTLQWKQTCLQLGTKNSFGFSVFHYIKAYGYE